MLYIVVKDTDEIFRRKIWTTRTRTLVSSPLQPYSAGIGIHLGYDYAFFCCFQS